MISLVAGLVEEAAFRGYMQVPLEKKYGPAFAIIVVGIMFGLAHFTHANMSLLMMPLFIVSSVIYGLLAYISKSIIPGIILHGFGDALELMLIWLAGVTLTSGIKDHFIIIVFAVVFLIASIIIFKKLHYEMKRNLVQNNPPNQ
jgi:membrane protease YdiL (CAAX protease family)